MDSTKRYNFWPGSFHAEKGAFAIAVIGTALAIVTMILSLIRLDISNLIGGIFGLLIHVSIIVAQRRRSPGLYLPYIVCSTLSLIVAILLTVVFIVFAIFMPAAAQHLGQHADEGHTATPGVAGTTPTNQTHFPVDPAGIRIFWATISIFFVLLTMLQAWLLWIVWRAREYMIITNAAAVGANLQQKA